MSKVTADYIKAVVLGNLRFLKQVKYAATEAGRFNSDVLTINKNARLIEIEVKVTKSDLRNDFKKPKHRVYQQKPDHPWTPHQFYFAVPDHLVEYAVAQCVGKPYGVIRVSEDDGEMIKRTWKVMGWHNFDEEVKRVKDFGNTTILLEDRENNRIEYAMRKVTPFNERFKVIKRAGKLSDKRVDRNVVGVVVSRMSSEIANLRRKLLDLKNKKS